MLSQLRSSLTYANVMATIAVFIALGGTSYAVATGSIDTREIRNNTVRSGDVRNNDVRGRDIRDGTIRSVDVLDGSLLSGDFQAGQLPSGPQGERGLQGEEGDTGPPGISGLEEVNAFSAFDSTSPKGASAVCPEGKRVIGGGAFVNAFGGPVALRTSVPQSGSGISWIVEAYEPVDHAGNWNVNARALCANVAP